MVRSRDLLATEQDGRAPSPHSTRRAAILWGMGKVERLMIEAIAKFCETHSEGMTADEALDAITQDDPKLRLRPAYKYCYDRLDVRGMLDRVGGVEPPMRYRLSAKALTELASSPA